MTQINDTLFYYYYYINVISAEPRVCKKTLNDSAETHFPELRIGKLADWFQTDGSGNTEHGEH